MVSAQSLPAQQQASKPPAPSDPRAEGAWFQLSHFGKQLPAPDARIKALQQAAALPQFRLNGTPASWPNAAWTPLGPQPIDSTTCPNYCNNYGLNSGRITAMAVNPTNSNEVWAGAADGGVWHSTDGGAHWSAVTDTQPTLSIGAIAIDPNNPNTIYVGTGEANSNGDAFWGAGILKSTDDGATWTQLGFSQFGGLGIAKIAVDPNNSNNVLVAAAFDGFTAPPGSVSFRTNPGIWRSTDGGSHWTEVKSDPSNPFTLNPDSGTDIVFDPAHSGVVFAGIGNIFSVLPSQFTSIAGVYKSTDHGATWTPLTNGIPSGNDVERVSLGISHDGQHVYAVLTDSGTTSGIFGQLLNSAIYVSSTNGSSWAAQNVSSVTDMANDDGEDQWWYDSYAAVDPTDSTGNTAYVGGVDIWQTTNGGTNWTNLTNAYGIAGTPAGVHPDQHALAFLSSSSSSYYLGNDGGVWSGTSGGAFTNLNGGGLNITQFYGGSFGSVGTDAQLYGGAQDNGEDQLPVGSPLTGAVKWNESFGGDGGDTVVDYTNNAIVYEETPGGNISVSTDGGATWTTATSGLGGNANFIVPFIMSPNNHMELIAGFDTIFKTTNGAGSWSPISPSLDSGTPMSALAIAPGNDNYIYAGDDNGKVFVTTNGGATWGGGAVPGSTGGIATGLAVDPTNPAVAYVTFADFASGSGHHVFKTTNAGASWTDVSASLPNIPFESILVSPNYHNLVIAGSDVGVFASQNGGTTWSQLGTGLPNVAIDQLFANQSGTQIFAATHGRGIWQLPIGQTPGQFQTNPAAVNLATTPGTSPSSQMVTLSNTGPGSVNWSAGSLPSWVMVSPTSGTLAPGASQPLTLTFNTTSSTPQTYTTMLTITDTNPNTPAFSLPITVVAANVSKTWYFAEGYTGGSFSEFLTLANPNSMPANVTVQYFLGTGAVITKLYPVPATSRFTVKVNNEVGSNQNVSMVVTSDQPIIAERPMYFTFTGLSGYTIPGGSDVLGATGLSQNFDFGYLDTTKGHATFLTILNQNNVTMNVTITYFPAAGGAGLVYMHAIPANSRGTVNVNAEVGLPAGTYSALVSLDQPGLVERPLYLKDSTTGYTGSADVVGVATPQQNWYFAEGFTYSTFDERYILSNPSTTATAHATITFLESNGTTKTAMVTLVPGQQQIVDANSILGLGVNNSAVVSADAPILAERFISFKYTGQVGGSSSSNIPGASDVLGASAPSNLFYFAEGYTGNQFAEYLTIENPSTTQTAYVTVTFLPANGSPPIVKVYTIAPSSRFTLFTNSVLANASFSLVVESNVAIVAERPMYFNFSNGQTGGSDVVGYQP